MTRCGCQFAAFRRILVNLPSDLRPGKNASLLDAKFVGF